MIMEVIRYDQVKGLWYLLQPLVNVNFTKNKVAFLIIFRVQDQELTNLHDSH